MKLNERTLLLPTQWISLYGCVSSYLWTHYSYLATGLFLVFVRISFRKTVVWPIFPDRLKVIKMNVNLLATKSNDWEKNSSSRATSTKAIDRNITVRFELNKFDTVAQVYPELTTIADVLDDVSAKFQLLPKYLTIRQKSGGGFPKGARLIQLCTNSFRIFDVTLGLSDLAKHINESISNEHEKIRLDTTLYYR